MIWIAPSEKNTDNAALEKRRRFAAGQFRASSAPVPASNRKLTVRPSTGLGFRRFAPVRFTARLTKSKAECKTSGYINHR